MHDGQHGLQPAEAIAILYRGALGREPDPAGLEHHLAMLELTGDIGLILEALATSPEAHERAEASAAIGQQAHSALGRTPVVVDVGAQELVAEEHVYTPLRQLGPLDVYGFDPLAERLDERRHSDRDQPGMTTLFPVALGDGREHDLHVNNDDSTSSLFSLDSEGVRGLEHLADLRTERIVRLLTSRLDEVELPGQIDLLKIDVQGAELMVMGGGIDTLARTSTIHCEVEFRPIYRGQPLMHEVTGFLLDRGFVLVDLFPKRYRYTTAARSNSRDQLMWADACYMRKSDDPHILLSQALIAALVYAKPNLAEHLLLRAGFG